MVSQNNLYPPIFYKSFMPAFTDINDCRIYFGLSAFNNLNQINTDLVLITMQEQKTNKNIFNKKFAPAGVFITGPIEEDSSVQGQDRYFVKIPPNAQHFYGTEVNGYNFLYNTYYKVQLRFTKKGTQFPGTKVDGISVVDNNWINNNLQYLSQWSSVVLIRQISVPEINININDLEATTESITHFTMKDIVVNGSIGFTNSSETEKIKSYRIRLYNSNDEQLEDSDDIYIDPYKNSKVKVFYRFKYDLQVNQEYYFTLSLITQELYSLTRKYKFLIDQVIDQEVFLEGMQIESQVDQESGRIGIHIFKDQIQMRQCDLVIKRTSSQSGFKIWEEMFHYSNPLLSIIDLTWFDKTVESGVYYLYGVEKVLQDQKSRSTMLRLVNPVRADFKNILLTTKDNQLKLKYNGEISNILYNISQNKIETIGGKYPIITRNGNKKYRTLSLSGLITYLMDIRENTMNASRNQLYGEQANLYKTDNQLRNISSFNDPLYERDFREKILEFLQQNDIKMLRTLQQGNILVKLMDISVTPMVELKGYLYSFSCTAVEIDDFNIENLKKYDLIDFGNFIKYDSVTQDFLFSLEAPRKVIYPESLLDKDYEERGNGAIGLQYFVQGTNILSHRYTLNPVLRQLYSENISNEEVTSRVKISKLTHLRIELSNLPYPIYQGETNLIADQEEGSQGEKINTTGLTEVSLGHLVEINGQRIIINKYGILELSGKNVEITSIVFPYPREQGSIIMQGKVELLPKKLKMPKKYETRRVIGQIWQNFESKENIINKIYLKYTQGNSIFQNDQSVSKIAVTTELQKVNGLRFYGIPGTIIYVRELQDTILEKHILGEGQMLEFYDSDSNIKEAYFYGIHLIQRQFNDENDIYGLYPYEFVNTGISGHFVNNKPDIEDPINNCVYIIDGENYIFYNQSWLPFPDSHEITSLPIEGIVDYSCVILTREFE